MKLVRARRPIRAALVQTGPMGAATPTQRLVEYVDRNHPKLGSAVMKARWGGLRTVEPRPILVVPVLGAGTAGALALRHVVGRRVDGRSWLPAALVGPAGAALAWLSLWRWDSARWRGNHVTMVLDVTAAELEALVSVLAEEGIEVQRWYGRSQPGAAAVGLTCRLKDLRRVNSLIGRSAT